MKQFLKIFIIGLGLASAAVITMVVSPWVASSEKNKILIGHNFDVGDWLLVNVNYAQNTLQLIDDERVLHSKEGKENCSLLFILIDILEPTSATDGFAVPQSLIKT